MRLGRTSSNVEDRRGMGGPLVAGGGIGAVVIALLVYFLGGDPSVVQQIPQGASQQRGGDIPADDPGAKFVSQVLADTEDTWTVLFREQLGAEYRVPRLVLFDGTVQSACGIGQSAMGPFYCPPDQQVYIDLAFYRELQNRFRAPGDFAQAYVIAHEVGHHVQNLLGISEQVHSARSRMGEEQGNALSVRQELQADCLAGVWAHHSQRERNTLEPGDIEEGLNAASAIGDDKMQKQAQGYVVPESFTHGSSAQRVEWFKRGYQQGTIEGCNTFDRRM